MFTRPAPRFSASSIASIARTLSVPSRPRRHATAARTLRGPVHAIQELPGIGAEGLDVAPLAFRIQRVEHEARLARAARTRDHGHLAGADVEVEVLEVVLAGSADADETGGHRVGSGRERRDILESLVNPPRGRVFERRRRPEPAVLQNALGYHRLALRATAR